MGSMLMHNHDIADKAKQIEEIKSSLSTATEEHY